MITSTKNAKIKWVRSLQSDSRVRRQQGAFIIEGTRLAEEASFAGWSAKLVLYTEGLDARGHNALAKFEAKLVPCELVTESVMRAASDTQNPQGILVVLDIQPLPIPDTLDFVLIPDSVRDPGNLGGMLRTAAAAGLDAVFIPPGTVDPYAPKVVRAAMGAHFRVPILERSWDDIETIIKHLQVILASVERSTPYYQVDLRPPVVIIIGGEAEGAGIIAHHLATRLIYIPMPGGAESLNTAVAAGILIFEVLRQRRVFQE